MFKYITSLIIDSDDRLCVYAFEALGSLFKEREEGRLRGLSQELEANGSDEEILNPLIEYLTNGLIQSLSLIIYRACSIDFRIRVKIIYPLTKLVLLSKNPIEIRRLEKECLLPVLYNLEKGIIWQASKCLIMLKPEISSLWAMCSQLLDQSPSEANPTPLLLLVTEAMSQLPISLQLSISLETLRHSNRIPSTVDRFSVLLSCLSSIVKLSKILLQSNEPSAIYQLFSQTWFVEMWMHGKHSQFREEMLCCLVESCLANYEASENWLTVGLEVVDVCFKVLDWPCDQDATYCATYFFLLLEEVCTLSRNSPLVDRVQQTLENLISRLSDSEILHYYSYAYTVLICSKYWLPLDELTLSKFMDIVRIKLFSTEIVKIDINIYKQSIQFLVCSCMHLARRFSKQCGNIMHKNLTDYLELIEESQSDQDNISKIISLIEGYAENLEESEFSESSPLEKPQKNYKKEPSGYFYQFLERIHVKFDEKTEEVYESMHAALNIFNRSRNESFCTTRPLEMLRIAQPEKELNWRCLKQTEITGVCDPLRAFCTHVIYPQYSLVVFCIKFYNTTKFQLTSIQIKFLISQNLILGVKQRGICNIGELSTGEVFEWKVRAVINSPGEISGSLLITFLDPTLPCSCTFETRSYYVPVPDILLRDISSGNLLSKFLILWTSLAYSITVRCELVKDFESMTQEIAEHMEQIDCGTRTQGAFQGVTLQGDRIAIYITGSKASKNVRLEYRTNSVDLLKNFTSQTDVFLHQLSHGKLKVLS
ncbi:hypothetical protein SteCoe_17374 [Stentor coeruleus]|uniref:AP-5 complex subunit beta-1 n=1 Tax=Stentor coeruleus TaxID=5963 RepID=A0A1R2BZ36_9CILI|nr:hypothetical protein SteCoe_17374 [Stentor coeruleus]